MIEEMTRSLPNRPAFPFLTLILLVLPILSPAQIIEFRSNGLKYQALTRQGLTVMWARMPLAIEGYGVAQVALNNGSGEIWNVKPTDFFYITEDGRRLQAVSENVVVYDLFRHAGHSTVMKLQSAYERALYGNQHIRSSNGYEQRRLNAAAMGPKGVKAAAAASAITFVASTLAPGDSTDGAVFFRNGGRQLGGGRVHAVINGQEFEFEAVSSDEPIFIPPERR